MFNLLIHAQPVPRRLRQAQALIGAPTRGPVPQLSGTRQRAKPHAAGLRAELRQDSVQE